MSLFDIFRKKTPADGPDAVAIPTPTELTPEATSPQREVVTIHYGTNMPIDAIYAFIGHDYEQDGYQDALVNSNAEYCKAKENIILNELRLLFRRIQLRYNGEIRGIDVRIENSRALFDMTTVSTLESRKQTCEEHIAEINRMVEKLEAKSPEMMTMIESYRRGFTKGCAAQTATFLRPEAQIN